MQPYHKSQEAIKIGYTSLDTLEKLDTFIYLFIYLFTTIWPEFVNIWTEKNKEHWWKKDLSSLTVFPLQNSDFSFQPFSHTCLKPQGHT